MSSKIRSVSFLTISLSLLSFFIVATPVKANILTDFRDKLTSIFSSNTDSQSAQSNNTVLGSESYQNQPTSIYINGENNRYSSGGLITQATTDEPAINVSGYNIPKQLEIKIYKATQSDLFAYLTHDKDGNQLNQSVSTSSMQYEGTVAIDTSINGSSSYNSTHHPLPVSGRGIWYLQIKSGSIEIGAYLLRSDHGVMVTEGSNELVFWAQDFQTLRKKSDGGGNLRLYNFLGSVTELSTSSFNDQGIATTQLTDKADLAISQFGDDIALVPINLSYLNTGYGYSQFTSQVANSRYFTFADRPLYSPGDTLHFKSIIRDDLDAQYSIPSGLAHVTISSGNEDQFKQQKTLPISADGSISGDFELKDAPLGYYSLTVQTTKDKNNSDNKIYTSEYTGVSDYSSTSFQVEHYRKPELFLEASVNNSVVSAGTPIKYVISGEYFAGQPLSSQEISYKVTAADYYEYNFLSDDSTTQQVSDDFRYGAWYGSELISEGKLTLDNKGQSVLELPTSLAYNENGTPQVFMLEATLADGEQDSAFVRKNVLVKAGRLSLYATDYIWGAQKNQNIEFPLIIKPNEEGEQVSNVKVIADIKRSVWKKEVIADQKYPRYTQENFEMGQIESTTNKEGRTSLRFSPTEFGSYTLTVSLSDSIGNKIKKEYSLYVSDQAMPSYNPTTNSDDLSLTSSKNTYRPNQEIPLTATSAFKNRDAFLSVERGHTRRYEVISFDGTSKSFNLPLESSDQPNIYLNLSSFSSYRYDSVTLPITIDSGDKKMQIKLTPDRQKYGPGDNVTIDISTTNDYGSAVSAEVALWSVDKALYELMDSRLGNIFETFWATRSNSTSSSHSLRGIAVQVAERGGGCFLPGTQIAMADGSIKPIEQVKVGNWVKTFNSQGSLVTAQVTATPVDSADGYLTINNTLRVTADHLLNVNGDWRQAGNINPGDYLYSETGAVLVETVFWQANKSSVYNLTIDKEHTFIADGVWVHNEKGMDRTAFKDVAYWNPTIRTDSSGKAQITFKLPDNLTTWTLNAVGSNRETVVGQSQVEITTTKDIVLKPILPNIIRSGDELTVSAIARNFTDQDDTYDLALSVEGGKLLDSASSVVTIKSQESVQSYWRLKPEENASKLKLQMSVISRTDNKKGDRVTQELPISLFGFVESNAMVGNNTAAFDLTTPADALNPQTKVALSLAPSIITSLQPSMQYLVHYPYGCVEQLTSSTAPTLIAKEYPELFPDMNKDNVLDEYIKAGITKITDSHDSFSGWGWWSHTPVSPFVTSYVLETLVKANELGYVKETKEAIVDATNYLSNPHNGQGEELSNSDRAIARYGLSLVNKAENFPQPKDLESLSDDILAMAVIGNYKTGDKNPASNGLDLLISRARREGNQVYWSNGDYSHFGSRDASTAWAIRAIVLAGGDRELAVSAANYLLNNRRNNYWSNTYGTVVTIRALFELYENGGESNPNFSYTVKLDGKEIKSGKINSATAGIADLQIPITQKSHKLEITKSGEGQLYSSVVSSLYRTDSKADADSNGLAITREYKNAKNPDLNIALGDIVEVILKVSGDGDFDRQGVIEDQLPAGLIPVNESFKNEQANVDNSYQYWSTKQFTQNGVVIAAYNLGKRSYSYRARVVSMGTFQIPPATASLMYSPEISGRTGVDTMTISSESKLLPGKALEATLKKITSKQYIVAIILIIAAIITSILLYRRYRLSHSQSSPTHQQPPNEPPAPNDQI